MVPVGFQRCKFKQTDATGTADVEMDGAIGCIEQLIGGRQLQRQLEEPAQGIDVLPHQDWVAPAGGSQRNRPQQAV